MPKSPWSVLAFGVFSSVACSSNPGEQAQDGYGSVVQEIHNGNAGSGGIEGQM